MLTWTLPLQRRATSILHVLANGCATRLHLVICFPPNTLAAAKLLTPRPVPPAIQTWWNVSIRSSESRAIHQDHTAAQLVARYVCATDEFGVNSTPWLRRPSGSRQCWRRPAGACCTPSPLWRTLNRYPSAKCGGSTPRQDTATAQQSARLPSGLNSSCCK